MQRIPEPEELMDDADQALAYAQADFSDANQLFVGLLEGLVPDRLRGHLLDLGCGPADIPLRLVRCHPELQIDALDGAPAMLELARQALAAGGDPATRIQLLCEYLPCPRLARGHYHAIVSNSLLHHLADPQVMWQAIARSARPGAYILVMDLARPATPPAVEALVERYADDAPEVLRRDFRNSLFAAYTPAEVEAQLRDSGLECLTTAMVSDRHLAVTGRLPS